MWSTPNSKRGARELNDRYKNLSAVSRGLYQAFKAIHGVFYKQKREAELNALMRGAVPDASPAEIKAFTDTVKSRKSFDAFMDKPENSAIAKALGDDKFKEYKRVLRGVAKVYSHGFVEGDYFPLRREGNYVVTYGHAGEDDHGVEMFNKMSEAADRRAELIKSKAENVSNVMSKRESALSDNVTHPVVDELVGAMQRRGMGGNAEEVRNLLSSIMLEHQSRRAANASNMRRKGVFGALTDHGRLLANELLNTSGSLGHLEHGQERLDALHEMGERVRALGSDQSAGPRDATTAGAVLNELQQRANTVEDPQGVLGSLGRKASAASYALNVQSPSHMLTSSIEAHMNAMPILGSRHGHVQAGLAIAKALAQAGPKILGTGVKNTLKAMGGKLQASDWNLSHYVRDQLVSSGASQAHMNRLFSALEAAGLIDHTMNSDIRRLANPTGVLATKAGNVWQRFTDFNAAGAHAVDVMNKGVIAKAAFDLEMKKSGGDVARSVAYATETARKVMPNYNISNKSRIATSKGVFGRLGAPMMQFKNYGFHELGVLANLAQRSFAKLPSEERKEARIAFAGVLATRAMMAGTLTLIADPLRYVGGAYDLMTGADKPHDYETDVRRWITSWAGPEMGAVLARGAPYALGMDIHRRVGLANILEIPELDSFDKAGMFKMIASAALGASGENAANIGDGMSKIAHGDIMGGLMAGIPRVVRDPIKAINLASKGVTDSKGGTVTPPEQLSGWDVGLQAAGVQPARVSEIREHRNAITEREHEVKVEHDRLVKQWVDADPADRPTVMHQIHDFTQDPRNASQRITIGGLMRAANDRKKQPNAPYGLKLPKRGQASLLDAANF